MLGGRLEDDSIASHSEGSPGLVTTYFEAICCTLVVCWRCCLFPFAVYSSRKPALMLPAIGQD